jgi:4-hydroxy-tetrahydrodipicolinate reductase
VALRIGIFGRGRLGSLVEAAVRRDADLELVWALGRDEQPSGAVDVAVDVTHADAVGPHLAWARDTGTDLVIGTTGWSTDLLGTDTDIGTTHDSGIGVLVAPNFSLSVALMRRLATVIGGYAVHAPEPVDLAVTDTHHRGKVDAPSGTAAMLRDALALASGRAADEVQTTSLRMGTVVGRHSVLYESASESLVITHEAHTREVFAAGALAAARWVHGRPGTHTVDDWAHDQLHHLFSGETPHP